jgi:hypothetical protein
MWATQEGGVTFNPKEVKAGNIIFVRSIDKFFKEIHPHIEHPYIIVSAGDSTDQMWDHHKQYLDQEKIIAWFGIHPNQMAIRHPKFHPIPLGIYQDPMLYDQREALNNRFKILRTTVEKKYLLYLSFTVTLNDGTPYAGRKEIREKFLKESYIHYPGVLKFDDYLTEAAKSYFNTVTP